MKAQFKIIIN